MPVRCTSPRPRSHMHPYSSPGSTTTFCQLEAHSHVQFQTQQLHYSLIMDGPPDLGPISLFGITLYFEDKRIFFRPKLRPSMPATDLSQQAFILLMQVSEAEYPATDLQDLLSFLPDSHAFVSLMIKEGGRLFFRTVEEFESDADLWDEVLDAEFPDRLYKVGEVDDEVDESSSCSSRGNKRKRGEYEEDGGEMFRNKVRVAMPGQADVDLVFTTSTMRMLSRSFDSLVIEEVPTPGQWEAQRVREIILEGWSRDSRDRGSDWETVANGSHG
ncbi:hypothetical protein GE09DRAFT_1276878 [Coniochaeta sp. 2T2.1]|nr:hypothetical protein GE09DRAFT_1276878 [Coniochaeta sp. 2T2.1]